MAVSRQHCQSYFIPAILLLFLCTGCGPAISDAEGIVTFNGKPLVCGAVIFVGPDGMTKGANIQEMTGKYHIKEVGSGEVGIAVVSYDPADPLDQEKPSSPNDPKKTNWSKPNVDRSKWFPLPQKYEMIHTSGIKKHLLPGHNSGIDIALE